MEEVYDISVRQFPITTVLSCIDSDVSVELYFDEGIGDSFSYRNGDIRIVGAISDVETGIVKFY